MRHPGVDYDGVGWLIRAESETVGREDCRLRPSGGETLLGSGGEDRGDLGRGNPSGGADNFGEDGTVVAGAGPDMDDMVATAQFELVVHTSPKAGLPVVEAPPRRSRSARHGKGGADRR